MVEQGENKDGQHTLIVTYLYEAPREERTVWTVGPLTPDPPKPLHMAGRREERDGRGCWVVVVVVGGGVETWKRTEVKACRIQLGGRGTCILLDISFILSFHFGFAKQRWSNVIKII